MANHYLTTSLSFPDGSAPFEDASVRAHRSSVDGDPIVAIEVGDLTIQRGGADAGAALAAGLRRLADRVEHKFDALVNGRPTRHGPRCVRDEDGAVDDCVCGFAEAQQQSAAHAEGGDR